MPRGQISLVMLYSRLNDLIVVQEEPYRSLVLSLSFTLLCSPVFRRDTEPDELVTCANVRCFCFFPVCVWSWQEHGDLFCCAVSS